jgi:predicted MPP superfamily phosphohydrolase
MGKQLFKKNRLAILLCGFFIVSLLCLNALAADIVIFGDSQGDEVAQRKVVEAIAAYRPSIVFRVGDNVDNGNDSRQWKLFNDINAPLLKTAEYFPALGNHEKDSPLYFANFPFLKHQRWYVVEREGIHFIVLDSNSSLVPGSKQYKWLESDLRRAQGRVKFKVALFHHPIFAVGQGHSEDEERLRPILLPLFHKYGISVVFSGHEHSYQRFAYQGMYFIVTGGGGSRLRDQARVSPYLQKFKKAYHFCLLAPGNDFLSIRVIDVDANIIDEFKVPALVSGGRAGYIYKIIKSGKPR